MSMNFIAAAINILDYPQHVEYLQKAAVKLTDMERNYV